jgi:hypothetical protein
VVLFDEYRDEGDLKKWLGATRAIDEYVGATGIQSGKILPRRNTF